MVLYREEGEEGLVVRGEERRREERGKRRDLAVCLIGDAHRRGSCFRDTTCIIFVRDRHRHVCMYVCVYVLGCTVCEYWGGTADWCKAKLRSDDRKRSEMMVVMVMVMVREKEGEREGEGEGEREKERQGYVTQRMYFPNHRPAW